MAATLNDLYRDAILYHYRNQDHRGLRAPFDVQIRKVNPVCGDEVTLRISVERDDVIQDASYESLGCSISQASTSAMVCGIIGKSMIDVTIMCDTFAAMMKPDSGLDLAILGDAAAFVGVLSYPFRVNCALLGWTALECAIERYRETK